MVARRSAMVPAGPFDGADEASAEELRQRLHSLHALIDQAPVPIAIAHDPACRTITANRALAVLLRLPSTANISLTPPPGESPPYRIQRDGCDIPPDELKSYIIKKYSSRKIFYQQATVILPEENISMDDLVNKIFHANA